MEKQTRPDEITVECPKCHVHFITPELYAILRARAERGAVVGEYVWKLHPVALPSRELAIPERIHDPVTGALGGIQFAATFSPRGRASDECPVCTLKGIHSHGMEELARLREMTAFLESKLGVSHPAPAGMRLVPEAKFHEIDERALDSARLDWLDAHCSFVADGEYNIGPFAIGELRQLADAGIAADWARERAATPEAK